LAPKENTSNGKSVAIYDEVSDPEDTGEDIEAFARFMRSTKVPPRDEDLAATTDSRLGDQVFSRLGCDTCHVRNITTAPAGTIINQGAFTVPPAVGNVTIHPFGDFLLHNVGTGDGIVQNGGPSTRNKVRTAPLWGLRTRSRLMHDGLSMTRNDAIQRHGGEAQRVTDAYRALSSTDRQALLTFLDSL
ncbi:MAG TPA: di-heme oxidoredictase family protein, partial [Candidatus Polarisedimenticolia bacterium]|nr:di-heme oxidoredictase family protein [Candidatus Polarisedimenticolia bacterium]